jgi:hypothetical protein
MAITATFEIAPTKLPAVVKEVFEVTSAQAELTPRSIEKLTELAKANALAVVYKDNSLIGWAAVERLTKNFSEIGMVFIKPEHRSAEVFNGLMQLVAKRKDTYLLATYDQALIRYVKTVWDAKEINLLGAILLSHGKFLTKRLNSESWKSISTRLNDSKPSYAIIERG